MCSNCKWEEAVGKCDAMLDDPDFAFAYDTLEGMAEWIRDKEHVTERQEEAIDNIANSVYNRGH